MSFNVAVVIIGDASSYFSVPQTETLPNLLQTCISDLHDKMIGISLYGVITEIFRDSSPAEVVFSLTIEDKTGATCAKLHFAESWYEQRNLLPVQTLKFILPLFRTSHLSGHLGD